MNTIDDLMTAIIAAPDEDTPRLMLADALEERDGPGDAARARFIKAQYRRRELGAPPKVVEVGSVRERGGPNYYQFLGSDEDGLAVGDRVDVQPYTRKTYPKARPIKEPKVHHGLLVRRIEVDDPSAGTTLVTAVADARSTPYPHAEVEQLDREIQAAVNKHSSAWCPWPHQLSAEVPLLLLYGGSEPLKAVAVAGFERGLVSRAVLSWDAWTEHGNELTKHLPICDVALTGVPHVRPVHSAPRWEYRLRRGAQGSWGDCLRPHDSAHVIHLSDEEHETLVDLDAKENHIRAQLLERAWPRVARWTWPGRGA